MRMSKLRLYGTHRGFALTGLQNCIAGSVMSFQYLHVSIALYLARMHANTLWASAKALTTDSCWLIRSFTLAFMCSSEHHSHTMHNLVTIPLALQ